MGQSILRDRVTPFQGRRLLSRLSKGNPVNIPEPGCRSFHGNVNELGDASEESWEEFSFLLNSRMSLEIRLTGDKAGRLAKHAHFRRVRCASDGP